MSKNAIHTDIIKCCEDRFKRGSATEWKHSDFFDLNREIFQNTGINISPKTLKRIFGKVAVDDNYIPRQATIDALSKYGRYSPAETPVQPDETLVQQDEAPVQPDETLVQPDEAPVQPDETLVQQAETPVQPDEVPVQQDEALVQPDEVPVQQDEALIQPDEFQDKPDETLVQPDEAPVQSDAALVQQDEFHIQPDEIPVQSVENPAQPEEVPAQPVEIPAQPDEILKTVEQPVAARQVGRLNPSKWIFIPIAALIAFCGILVFKKLFAFIFKLADGDSYKS